MLINNVPISEYHASHCKYSLSLYVLVLVLISYFFFILMNRVWPHLVLHLILYTSIALPLRVIQTFLKSIHFKLFSGNRLWVLVSFKYIISGYHSILSKCITTIARIHTTVTNSVGSRLPVYCHESGLKNVAWAWLLPAFS